MTISVTDVYFRKRCIPCGVSSGFTLFEKFPLVGVPYITVLNNSAELFYTVAVGLSFFTRTSSLHIIATIGGV